MRISHPDCTTFSRLSMEQKIATARNVIEVFAEADEGNEIEGRSMNCSCKPVFHEDSRMGYLNLHNMIAEHSPIKKCTSCGVYIPLGLLVLHN